MALERQCVSNVNALADTHTWTKALLTKLLELVTSGDLDRMGAPLGQPFAHSVSAKQRLENPLSSDIREVALLVFNCRSSSCIPLASSAGSLESSSGTMLPRGRMLCSHDVVEWSVDEHTPRSSADYQEATGASLTRLQLHSRHISMCVNVAFVEG